VRGDVPQPRIQRALLRPHERTYGAAVPTSYRIAEAATLLGVSDDTVRRWIDSDRLAASRDAGGPAQIDGADLAPLAGTLHEPPAAGTTRSSSARNRMPGIVTRVLRDTVMAQVEIQAGPFRLVSLMSREAADELGLEPGVRAVATVKATQVSVDVP
jgi:molybdopterin-binding protein